MNSRLFKTASLLHIFDISPATFEHGPMKMTEFCTDQALLAAIMPKFSTGSEQRFEKPVQSFEQAGALSGSEQQKTWVICSRTLG